MASAKRVDGCVVVALNKIDMPRENYSRGTLAVSPSAASALADSIEATGWVSPLVVMPLPKGRYELVAGFRRLAALRLLAERGITKWSRVPVQLRSGAERDLALHNVAENASRKELSLGHLARVCARLQDQHGATLDELVRHTGRSRTHISNVVAVWRDLHAEIQDGLLSGKNIPFRTLQDWRKRRPEKQLELYHRYLGEESPATETGEPTPPKTKRAPGASAEETYLDQLQDSKDPRHRFAARVLAWALGKGRKPAIK